MDEIQDLENPNIKTMEYDKRKTLHCMIEPQNEGEKQITDNRGRESEKKP